MMTKLKILPKNAPSTRLKLCECIFGLVLGFYESSDELLKQLCKSPKPRATAREDSSDDFKG